MSEKNELNENYVKELIQVLEKSGMALNAELSKVPVPKEALDALTSDKEVTANSAEDIAARYWLMQFLEPVSRKELKSIIDGFLVQLLNKDQSKKLVQFLMTRFPQYYKKSPEEEGQFKAKRPA